MGETRRAASLREFRVEIPEAQGQARETVQGSRGSTGFGIVRRVDVHAAKASLEGE